MKRTPIKIDKNVPVYSHKGRSDCRYPFKDMKITDSFFAEGAKPNIIQGYARKLAMKFTTRTVTENDKKGVRVWRIQ